MTGFLQSSVVHVHPTIRCNLTCAHCYSSSSPAGSGGVEVDDVLAALAVLRGHGYETVSLSGGEPLLHPSIGRLIAASAELGYRVNVVTNGMLIARGRLRALERAAFVAVSFDGNPERHDQLRRRDGAFVRAARGLDALAANGVAFGITSCVTRESLADVPWLYEFAAARGAKLLSLRPLAAVGRGQELSPAEGLDDVDMARLALLADLLDSKSGPRVRADVARAADVKANAERAFPILSGDASALSLRELVNPLIVEETGRLMPFAYGIHPHYTIGHVRTCRHGAQAVEDQSVGELRELLERALRDIPAEEGAYLDWYDHLTRTSYETAPVNA